MTNELLLSRIVTIQNSGVFLVKIIGMLLLNPLTAGIFTYLLIRAWGGSWLYMWIPAYLILAIGYFVMANLLIGVLIQLISIRFYRQMTDGLEKENAYSLIKKSR